MFYDNLIQICNEYGVKPTPVLKELGISPGNLKRWENGAAVNSDTLSKIANYFDVPVDYFFADDKSEKEIPDDNNSIRKIYSVLRAYPDHIASLLSGSYVSESEIKAIAGYMNCSVEYLLNGSDDVVASNIETIDDKACLSPKELILEILTRLAANKKYKALQVNISRIIINNLAKLNITQDRLLKSGLSSKKITDLYNREKSADSIVGLNSSDLIRIARKFDVGFEFMLTGNGD